MHVTAFVVYGVREGGREYQRLYMLAHFKRQGLDLRALYFVFNVIVVSEILCASPVYFRYLTQGHLEMLQRVFKTAYRRGFTLYEYDLEALAESAQHHLFPSSCSEGHCLYIHLYSP